MLPVLVYRVLVIPHWEPVVLPHVPAATTIETTQLLPEGSSKSRVLVGASCFTVVHGDLPKDSWVWVWPVGTTLCSTCFAGFTS